MMAILLVAILLFIPVNSFPATSVTQYGITWTFDADYTVGQFVNGDYYVIDPGSGVKITGISPGYTTTPRAMNGSMINPATATQGYDAYTGYNYSAAVNVGIGISPSTPLVLTGNKSLVSTISNSDAGVSNKSYVNTAAVLTSLTSVPPEGTFRPGISSTTKTLHNISDIDYTKIKSLSFSATKPNITTYANYLQMVWLTHDGGWTARLMHPSASGMDNYEYPGTFSTAAKLLCLDYTNNEKQQLLYNYIQLGIDIYSYLESGANGWPPDGGHSSGRKWPILFAGIVLNYAPMMNIGQKSGDYIYSNGHGPGNLPSDYIHFGEDGQTFYVSQTDVNLTNGGTWNPDVRNHTPAPYTAAMLSMPEWGIRYSTYPERSDASWLAEYRHVMSNGYAWEGFAISAIIMGAKSLWNHNAFFDFVDRFVEIAQGRSDPFGYIVPDEQIVYTLTSRVWADHRHDYPYPPYRRAYLNGTGSAALNGAGSLTIQ